MCSVTAEHNRRQAKQVRWSSVQWMISTETASTSCLSCCSTSYGAGQRIYAWRHVCHCRREHQHVCQTPSTQKRVHWRNQLRTQVYIHKHTQHIHKCWGIPTWLLTRLIQLWHSFVIRGQGSRPHYWDLYIGPMSQPMERRKIGRCVRCMCALCSTVGWRKEQ